MFDFIPKAVAFPGPEVAAPGRLDRTPVSMGRLSPENGHGG